MVDWEAVLALLGRKARLVWASDSDPVVKKYVLEKYKMDIWYDNAFRLSDGPAVPRCRIYTAGFHANHLVPRDRASITPAA